MFNVVGELQALPRAPRIVAETSTFTLDDKTAAQAQLAQAGIVMLDCPLSGSGVQALVRDVLVYGSGPKMLTIAVCRYSTDFRGRRIISAPSAMARR